MRLVLSLALCLAAAFTAQAQTPSDEIQSTATAADATGAVPASAPASAPAAAPAPVAGIPVTAPSASVPYTPATRQMPARIPVGPAVSPAPSPAPTAPSPAAIPAAVPPAPTPGPVSQVAPPVIMAPPAMPALPSGPAIASGPPVVATGDILGTLRTSGQFTILLRAIRDTNLEGVLRNNANLTLFAPPDAAFRALSPERLAALLAPQNVETLQKVLIYHLVNARVDGSDMRGAAGHILTVEGQDLRVDGRGRQVQVESARIMQPDVGATNGLIHVIDRVMIPPDIGGVLAQAPTGVAGDTAATVIAPTTQPLPR